MKKFVVHPVSLLVWLWILIVLGPLVAINYVLAIAIHEFGHFFVAKHLGYNLTQFSLSPYGAELKYCQNFQREDEIKIAVAGPLLNLISALMMLGVWWLFPSTYFVTESFVWISFVLALFNLLPAKPLDGGRIFVCMSQSFLSPKTANKITFLFNWVLAFLFFVVFVVCLFVNFNPSFLLFCIFLVGGALEIRKTSEYEKINVFCKESKSFSKPIIFYVTLDTRLKDLLFHMQNNKTCVFCVELDNGKLVFLSEKMVVDLSVKFDFQMSLREIFV